MCLEQHVDGKSGSCCCLTHPDGHVSILIDMGIYVPVPASAGTAVPMGALCQTDFGFRVNKGNTVVYKTQNQFQPTKLDIL